MLRLGHAVGQPRLLVGGEGELVAGQRLAPIAAQIRDNAEVVEAAGLSRVVVQCPGEIERRGAMRLGAVHVPRLQRDGALIVARPQLGVTFAPPAGDGERGCGPASRFAMGAQPPVRLGRQQRKRCPRGDRVRRQPLEAVQHLAVTAPRGQAAQLGEQRRVVDEGSHGMSLIRLPRHRVLREP